MITRGSQIRAARALIGWEQSKLASVAGMHTNNVRFWEGHRTLTPKQSKKCERIATALRRGGVEVFASPSPGVRLVDEGQEASADVAPVDASPAIDNPKITSMSEAKRTAEPAAIGRVPAPVTAPKASHVVYIEVLRAGLVADEKGKREWRKPGTKLRSPDGHALIAMGSARDLTVMPENAEDLEKRKIKNSGWA